MEGKDRINKREGARNIPTQERQNPNYFPWTTQQHKHPLLIPQLFI